jgi:hypothetical protein
MSNDTTASLEQVAHDLARALSAFVVHRGCGKHERHVPRCPYCGDQRRARQALAAFSALRPRSAL